MDELEQLLVETGDDIGEVMARLRARLQAARRAGNEDAAAAAELLYLQASEIQHARNRIILTNVVESDELRRLMDALRQANGALRTSIQEIADLSRQIGQLRQTLGAAEAAVRGIAGLLV
ncbi:MAG: hypothetical protein FJX54_06800 [Alphaproteobacteria bacterium]|nr:hypothetical protein [Alphaproteobacteria bacterium]